MGENIENLILEHLRAMRADIAAIRDDRGKWFSEPGMVGILSEARLYAICYQSG